MNRSRNKILDAGLQLFSEKGYSAVSTKELAAGAGISEVTLFRHFPKKRDIFVAIANHKIHYPSLQYLGPESFIGQWHTDMSRFSGILKQFFQENRQVAQMIWKDSENPNSPDTGIHNFVKEIENRIREYLIRFWFPQDTEEAENITNSYMSSMIGIMLNSVHFHFLKKDVPIDTATDILSQSLYEFLAARNSRMNPIRSE